MTNEAVSTAASGAHGDLRDSHSLLPSVIPPVAESLRYNGRNFAQWGQLVELTLIGRELNDHLSAEMDPSNPSYKSWKRDDAIVHVLLLSSMTKDQLPRMAFLKTAKQIWEYVEKNALKKSNLWRTYELVIRAWNLRQGDRSVTDYVNELQTIWLELDHYRPIRNPDEWEYTLRDRMFKFLMGLNPEYESVRSQILNREKIPDLEQAIYLILEEEGRLQVVSSTLKEEASLGMIAKVKNQRTGEADLQSADKVTGQDAHETYQNRKSQGSRDNKSSIVCHYCKRRGHTKDKCWDLYGRPPRAQAHSAHTGVSDPEEAEPVEQGNVKCMGKSNTEEVIHLREELEKLKALLSSSAMTSTLTRPGKEPEDFTL
ncbi:uncharacterized protein LOC144712663 [Wolffia australiana]